MFAHENYLIPFEMTNRNPRIRIKDIARLAGVSEGTVDRVLHDRGEVSARSREAVEKVLNEINYTPNFLARSLAIKKQHRIVCLIPAYQKGEYWERVVAGFNQAGKDYLQYNIVVDIHFFDQFDINSFIIEIRNILADTPDGVIFSPVFREESHRFTRKLLELNIPFSFIDSMIEDSEFLTYYGQNSVQSGYVAARLLLDTVPSDSKVLVVLTRSVGEFSNQTLSRLNGYNQYIQKHQLSGIKTTYLELCCDDSDADLQNLKKILEEENPFAAAITFNSRVYQLASYLEALNIRNIKIAGYDLLENNVRYLKNNTISFLIAQRPGKQAYLSVSAMCTSLIFKQSVKKINYVPIDILIRENIDSYIDFNE